MGDEKQSIEGYLKSLGASLGDAIFTNLNPTRIKKVFGDVETSAFEVAKQFGVGRENITNIKAAMTDMVRDAKLVGLSFENVAELQKDISEYLGRNILLNSETAGKVMATEKVLQGMGESFSNVASKFKDVGLSYMGVGSQVETMVNTARKMGVNAQAVVSETVKNLDKLNRYNFKNGVEGLSKMVAKAKVLKIKMNEIFDSVDKAFEPEGAIEMAAALQRLGVTQSELLDPLRLMDMSQNDPTEFMDAVGKMSEKFVQLNKDGRFEIMPGAKRQLMEISKAMGINYDELTKMAVGSKELEMKMSKIKFPSTFTDEQRSMIANMAEIGPGGEMKLRLDGKELGINEAMATLAGDKNALDKFMADSEPKTMEQLAQDQLTISEHANIILKNIEDRVGYGLASSKGFETLTQAQKEMQTAAIKATQSKVLSEKGMRGIGDLGDDLVKAMASKDEKKVQEIKSKISSELAQLSKDFTENPKKAFEELQKSNNIVVKSLFGSGANTTTTPTTSGYKIDETLGLTSPSKEMIQKGSVNTTTNSEMINKMNQIQKTESSQNITYTGKLDVSVENKTPQNPVDTSTIEKVIKEFMGKPEGKQLIKSISVDPQDNMNPLQKNAATNK